MAEKKRQRNPSACITTLIPYLELTGVLGFGLLVPEEEENRTQLWTPSSVTAVDTDKKTAVATTSEYRI